MDRSLGISCEDSCFVIFSEILEVGCDEIDSDRLNDEESTPCFSSSNLSLSFVEGGLSSERNSLASPSETDVSCVEAKDNVSCVSSSVKKLDGAEMDGNDEAGDGDSVDGDDNSSVCIVEMSFESGSGGSEFFNFNFGTRFGLTGFPQVVFVHTNLVFV